MDAPRALNYKPKTAVNVAEMWQSKLDVYLLSLDVNSLLVDVKVPLVCVNSLLVDVKEPLVCVNKLLVDVKVPLVCVNKLLVDVKAPLACVNKLLVDVKAPLVCVLLARGAAITRMSVVRSNRPLICCLSCWMKM